MPESMTNPPVVQVDGVTKNFGDAAAVKDVSFSVGQGEFLTLLGPSGSGKTTVLRMIAGFVQPDSGEIRINGKPISQIPPARRSIGVVFQSLALFPHLTVGGNVAYPLKARRFDPATIPGLVSRYLELVGLGGFEKRRVSAISGGQRQRVAIARALVYRPDLLLLDEPMASLDKKLREEMQVEFRRIQQELGVTTINVTHDQREALVMSDKIIVLDHGRVQQAGRPHAVYRKPTNSFVAGFIGHTNVLNGTIAAVTKDGVAVEFFGERIAVPETDAAGLDAGASVRCALRAEKVAVGARPADLNGVDVRLAGVVRKVAYEGDRSLYEVGTQHSDALVRVIDNLIEREIGIGDEVFIGFNAKDIIIMRE